MPARYGLRAIRVQYRFGLLRSSETIKTADGAYGGLDYGSVLPSETGAKRDGYEEGVQSRPSVAAPACKSPSCFSPDVLRPENAAGLRTIVQSSCASNAESAVAVGATAGRAAAGTAAGTAAVARGLLLDAVGLVLGRVAVDGVHVAPAGARTVTWTQHRSAQPTLPSSEQSTPRHTHLPATSRPSSNPLLETRT